MLQFDLKLKINTHPNQLKTMKNTELFLFEKSPKYDFISPKTMFISCFQIISKNLKITFLNDEKRATPI